eukprot:365279-Chlamydomonas_euryale.AAC.5
MRGRGGWCLGGGWEAAIAAADVGTSTSHTFLANTHQRGASEAAVRSLRTGGPAGAARRTKLLQCRGKPERGNPWAAGARDEALKGAA